MVGKQRDLFETTAAYVGDENISYLRRTDQPYANRFCDSRYNLIQKLDYNQSGR